LTGLTGLRHQPSPRLWPTGGWKSLNPFLILSSCSFSGFVGVTERAGLGIICGVIPDRVFGLEFSDEFGRQNHCWYFLEADCGTMPVTRHNLDQSSFYRKLLAYEATWRKELHRTRLGFDRFRVLTVTRSPQRVDHMLEVCSQLQRGQGLFLFTEASSLLAGGDVLTKGWRTVHERPETLC
jgi:hypothetical protein